MSPLKIAARDTMAGPVPEIIGALDHSSAIELPGLLATVPLPPGQRLVPDLADTEFRDSSGISALIAARDLGHAAQADTVLVAVPAHVLPVPRIVGSDQVLSHRPDNDTATRP
ncbi:STAS domain-containing protein [Streptomyces sp. TG1A-8]|uniref:STAS domain-containing protein n=1 Tax=Streptomyces sp. TG1A-8 TaxID=3051385 RepID=UPI00265C6FF0|nr:STAS domain-containing protein [Streptomyces sp. TG1A-8]MDO0924805.1 STAS domain-containing protein [Streptomyces sp. TG1A-8]